MRFSELSGPEIDRIDRDIPVLLPIARTVPRGPALPVGIESKILEDIVSRASGSPFLWLPTPPFASSPTFTGLTGRLAVKPTTFAAVVSDLLEGILAAGFRRILVLSVEESLSVQVRLTLESVRAENPTSLLFSASLQILGAADFNYLGHVATAIGLVAEFSPADLDLPLTPSLPEFIPLNHEISSTGAVLDPASFNREVGLQLRETSRQNLEKLLHQMTLPVTFQMPTDA
jgi:hypothetical protein